MSNNIDNLEFDEEIDVNDDSLNADDENGFKVHIDQFEGPIDLLLHLIKKARLDITEIALSEVTSSYLQYLEEADELDLNKASEFLVMAAQLVEIKAKSLLPKPQNDVDDDVEQMKEKILKDLQVRQYELFQKAFGEVKKSEEVNKYFRAPDSTVGDERVVLKDMTTLGLEYALSKIRERVEKRSMTITQREIVRDPYTVDDKIQFITDLLSVQNEWAFNDLFSDVASVSEIITTFQALLELMKNQRVAVNQTETFGDIKITKKVI